MKYKIWDKKSNINGQNASYFLKEKMFNEGDVFLVLNDYDTVTQIQSVNIIRANYNMPKELTSQEVAQKYIEIIEEQNKQQEETTTLEKQAVRIAELEQGQANTEYVLMMGGLL